MIRLAFSAALAAASMTVVIGLPGTAQAASIYGSSAILTNRPCPQATGASCASVPRTFTQFAGGMSTGFATSASNMNGSGAAAQGAVEFGDGYLPIVHAGSFAGAATRSGGNVSAFRSFTYDGARSINLALNGALDFTTSGNLFGNETAGEGFVGVILSIVPLSSLVALAPNASGQDIVLSNIGFMDCSSGAIASTNYSSIGTSAGAHVANLSLSQTCQGGAITLNQGDSFVIVTTLQAISNRSGVADATNTFKVQYDGANSVFVDTGQSVGTAFLQSAINGAVPEPATWATMVIGFAMAGAALRRQRSAPQPA